MFTLHELKMRYPDAGMRRSRSRQNPASARSGKLVRPTASSSPGSRVLVTQASLGPVSESMAERESASAKLDPPRANGHRRSRSWYMTSRKDRDDLRMPEEYHGTTNGTDSRASRTRGWLWSRTRDATEPAAGTDNAVTELLDSADEEVPSLTGIPSPSDGKVRIPGHAVACRLLPSHSINPDRLQKHRT